MAEVIISPPTVGILWMERNSQVYDIAKVLQGIGFHQRLLPDEPNNGPLYIELEWGPSIIGIEVGEPPSTTAYLNVGNVEKLVNLWKSQGIRLAEPLKQQAWGDTTAAIMIDGRNRLVVSQSTQAIKGGDFRSPKWSDRDWTYDICPFRPRISVRNLVGASERLQRAGFFIENLSEIAPGEHLVNLRLGQSVITLHERNTTLPISFDITLPPNQSVYELKRSIENADNCLVTSHDPYNGRPAYISVALPYGFRFHFCNYPQDAATLRGVRFDRQGRDELAQLASESHDYRQDYGDLERRYGTNE